jgi:hypothetical protein
MNENENEYNLRPRVLTTGVHNITQIASYGPRRATSPLFELLMEILWEIL